MPTVCVTGVSGFIGSHLTKVLLEKGYRVNGTVRDKSNEDKIKHLLELPNAKDNLTLFNADLMKEGSFDESMEGCTGVFHTASPFFFGSSTEEDFIPPAKEGTRNVLKSAAKNTEIKRVVLTSSMAAVAYTGDTFGPDHVYDHKDWSIEEYLRKISAWYPLSKTVAERLAWDFVAFEKGKGRDIELIVINPTLVTGPMLQKSINASNEVVQGILEGNKEEIPPSCMSFVDVRDVADAHVLAYEKGEPGARYVCMTASHLWKEWYDILREAAPDKASNIPTKMAEGDQKPPMKFDNSKLKDLGWRTIDFRTSLVDTVKSIAQ